MNKCNMWKTSNRLAISALSCLLYIHAKKKTTKCHVNNKYLKQTARMRRKGGGSNRCFLCCFNMSCPFFKNNMELKTEKKNMHKLFPTKSALCNT